MLMSQPRVTYLELVTHVQDQCIARRVPNLIDLGLDSRVATHAF